MSDVKPWHDAPPCPECKAPVSTPVERRAAYTRMPPASLAGVLYCPACGVSWKESDPARIAWAWWSVGAHEAKEMLS